MPGDGLPDSTGLVLGVPVGPGALVDVDGVSLGLPADGEPDVVPSPGDEPVPDMDGTGVPGTSVGEAEAAEEVGEADGAPGDPEVPGRSGRSVCRTVPGSPEGTPGTGSIVLGANGVAPRKLRASTAVYAAHNAPRP